MNTIAVIDIAPPPSFAVKSRPPQPALTRGTDDGLGRLKRGRIRPHPHTGQAGGSFRGPRDDRPRVKQDVSCKNIRLSSDEANPLSRSRN